MTFRHRTPGHGIKSTTCPRSTRVCRRDEALAQASCKDEVPTPHPAGADRRSLWPAPTWRRKRDPGDQGGLAAARRREAGDSEHILTSPAAPPPPGRNHEAPRTDRRDASSGDGFPARSRRLVRITTRTGTIVYPDGLSGAAIPSARASRLLSMLRRAESDRRLSQMRSRALQILIDRRGTYLRPHGSTFSRSMSAGSRWFRPPLPEHSLGAANPLRAVAGHPISSQTFFDLGRALAAPASMPMRGSGFILDPLPRRRSGFKRLRPRRIQSSRCTGRREGYPVRTTRIPMGERLRGGGRDRTAVVTPTPGSIWTRGRVSRRCAALLAGGDLNGLRRASSASYAASQTPSRHTRRVIVAATWFLAPA